MSLVASCADGCYFLGCCLVALVCAFRRLPTQGRFPSWPYTTNDFFDALFGDAEEGAYDIRLVVDPEESDDGELHFYFELHQRAGRCLVCSLTYGLPQVFERHPIINLKGLVSDIASRAGWKLDDVWWPIGTTESLTSALHRIPLVLIQNKGK